MIPGTPPPSPEPKSPPSQGRSPEPISPPSPAPTGACLAETTIEFATAEDGTDCTDIRGEQEPTCVFELCARELQFTYTGNRCNEGFETCNDLSNPTNQARVIINDADDPNRELFRGTVSIGDTITIGDLVNCLPTSIDVSISTATSSDSTPLQTSTIDTSCDGR